MIEKFILFCIVGFVGLLIDFGTTWLLKERLHLNKYLANATGFLLAASVNYILNRVWTFSSTNPNVVGEYTLFLLIATVGLAINSIILYLLVEKIELPKFEQGSKPKFYFSKLIAIGVVTIWNFVMNYFITFS